MRARLESPAATVRVGIVDACRGGGWTRAKGVTGEALEIRPPLELSSEGSALLASSSGVESAHESEALDTPLLDEAQWTQAARRSAPSDADSDHHELAHAGAGRRRGERHPVGLERRGRITRAHDDRSRNARRADPGREPAPVVALAVRIVCDSDVSEHSTQAQRGDGQGPGAPEQPRCQADRKRDAEDRHGREEIAVVEVVEGREAEDQREHDRAAPDHDAERRGGALPPRRQHDEPDDADQHRRDCKRPGCRVG